MASEKDIFLPVHSSPVALARGGGWKQGDDVQQRCRVSTCVVDLCPRVTRHSRLCEHGRLFLRWEGAFGAPELPCSVWLLHREAGGGGGGGVTVGGWCGRLLAPHPLAVHAPGQSLNLSECQFHHLQIHTENTAEGGQPTERGGTERGCQGEAGWAASRRPPGIRVNLASSLEVRSSVQARASNVTHHEGAHFFRGPVNTALAADSNLSALLLIQSEKSGHQESSLGKAQ